MRKIVAVVGGAEEDRTSHKFDVAFVKGKQLLDNGVRVQSGGHGGGRGGGFEGGPTSAK